MQSISKYTDQFNTFLQQQNLNQKPKGLFEPIEYILNLGGKRIRPALVLLSTSLFGQSEKEALNAALALELFHNFSLMHDDIMDEAPLRRQQSTVHEKWDVNTAILSGDAMLILSYQYFEYYKNKKFIDLITLFSRTAKEVCIGQQYDMDFETMDHVELPDYIEMVRLKTAVLVACAFQMGGIIAETSHENQQKLYQFGENLGIAFQIQDDLLDLYGDPNTFGKQIGGDIIENKKTFLFLKALELSSDKDNNQLKHLFSVKPKQTSSKIETVKQIFGTYNVKEESIKEIEYYTNIALQALNDIDIEDDEKRILKNFAEELMLRKV